MMVDARTDARPVGVAARGLGSVLGPWSSAAQNGHRVPPSSSRKTSGGSVRPQRVQGGAGIALIIELGRRALKGPMRYSML
jgi:hypothetical protein